MFVDNVVKENISQNENCEKCGNCMVAVCMGKSPLMIKENVCELFDYLVTKHQNIVVLICDEIHKFEKMIPKRKRIEDAEREALFEGQQLQSSLLQIQQEKHEWSQIKILRWKDIANEEYGKMHLAVQGIVDKYKQQFDQSSEYYIHNRLKIASVTEKRVNNFTNYTVAELPIQLYGIHVNGVQYSLIYHPVFAPSDINPTISSQPYFSPISDITNILRKDIDFMRDIDSIKSEATKPASLIRVYFQKGAFSVV